MTLRIAARVPPVEGTQVKQALIYLHGSGGDGLNSYENIKLAFGSEAKMRLPHTEIIFPTGPEQPYTPAFGDRWNVWFDREQVDIRCCEKIESVSQGASLVAKLVGSLEARGIPRNRIILGGLSMGGSMALLSGYHFIPGLAGIFAMSSFLNHDSIVFKDIRRSPSGTLPPLLMYHGTADSLVLYDWGKTTYERLSELGVSAEWRPIPGLDHSMTSEEIRAVFVWCKTIFVSSVEPSSAS